MNARKVAAQFAAHVWFENHKAKARDAEMAQFAKANWKTFLPIAHEGLGRLLIKIASGRSIGERKRRPLAHATCCGAGA